MGRIANEQHAAGHFRYRHHADNALVANDRLAFINAIDAALVDNDLIAVGIVNRRDNWVTIFCSS